MHGRQETNVYCAVLCLWENVPLYLKFNKNFNFTPSPSQSFSLSLACTHRHIHPALWRHFFKGGNKIYGHLLPWKHTVKTFMIILLCFPHFKLNLFMNKWMCVCGVAVFVIFTYLPAAHRIHFLKWAHFVSLVEFPCAHFLLRFFLSVALALVAILYLRDSVLVAKATIKMSVKGVQNHQRHQDIHTQ